MAPLGDAGIVAELYAAGCRAATTVVRNANVWRLNLRTERSFLAPEPGSRTGLAAEKSGCDVTVLSVVGFTVSRIEGSDVDPCAVLEDRGAV